MRDAARCAVRNSQACCLCLVLHIHACPKVPCDSARTAMTNHNDNCACAMRPTSHNTCKCRVQLRKIASALPAESNRSLIVPHTVPSLRHDLSCTRGQNDAAVVSLLHA